MPRGAEINWGAAIGADGRVDSRIIDGLVYGNPKRIPEPGTFPYAGAEDLDELGGHVSASMVLDDPSPYDFEKVGMRRNRVLIGSELASEHFDPALAHEVIDEIQELLDEVRSKPQLGSDPVFRDKVFACLRYAQKETSILDIIGAMPIVEKLGRFVGFVN